MPPHRDAGQAPQVRHDGVSLFSCQVNNIFSHLKLLAAFCFRPSASRRAYLVRPCSAPVGRDGIPSDHNDFVCAVEVRNNSLNLRSKCLPIQALRVIIHTGGYENGL